MKKTLHRRNESQNEETLLTRKYTQSSTPCQERCCHLENTKET